MYNVHYCYNSYADVSSNSSYTLNNGFIANSNGTSNNKNYIGKNLFFISDTEKVKKIVADADKFQKSIEDYEKITPITTPKAVSVNKRLDYLPLVCSPNISVGTPETNNSIYKVTNSPEIKKTPKAYNQISVLNFKAIKNSN